MAIKRQGKKQVDLPDVTTEHRSTEKGRIQFNTDTGLAEYYDGNQWKSIDSPPVVSSISPTTATASGVTITVTGSSFTTVGTTQVKLIGESGTELSGTSVNVTSSTSLTFVTPSGITVAEETWDVKVINPSGLSAIGVDLLDAGSTPSFSTSADTNIGTLSSGATDFSGLTTVVATDADGQSVTHTISAGSLPSGMSLATNGSFTGTAPTVGTNTNFTFTVSATDGTNTATRQFLMTVGPPAFMTATGGTETTDGDYKVHTFTSSGTFTVTILGSDSTFGSKVEYLVVAGGGGGGFQGHGGGGGAGGYRHNSAYDFTVSAQAYTITVCGYGGAKTTGGNSTFANITSAGGGRGGHNNSEAGQAGGSGGGGSGHFNSGSGGSGNSPSVSPSQGNSGGSGQDGNPVYGAGGGGGAGQGGQNGSRNSGGGTGGNGSSNDIHGSSRTYSAGGGGHGHGSPAAGGSSNLGGSQSPNAASGRNTANNYGAGGAGDNDDASNGVVIIRYKFQ